MTDMLIPGGALEAAGVRPGLLVFPEDAGWDEARAAWNLAVDQRPAAVALPETDVDVVAAVRYAIANGLRVAAQGTGHNAGPLGDLARVLLVKTHRMRGVSIDADAQVARVEAGALWKDVVGPAAEHGLAALSGSSPDVGVVGYSLGGGISWMARRYGLAANRVLAVELVTADGELVRADRRSNQDLFWALRGGGGNFGVVTALEFELFQIRSVEGGMMLFPIERATEVLNAWREWIATVPETVTSSVRILRVPPMPDIPEPVRGREFVVVEPYVVAGPGEADELVAPLRALGPEIDMYGTIPMEQLVHAHMDPEHPVPGRGDHQLLSELTDETIAALVDVAGAGVECALLQVEIRQLGGALARPLGGFGATACIDAPFATFAVGIAATPGMAEAVGRDLARVRDALTPWDAGREYLNFAETEHGSDTRRMFDATVHARLRAIKADVDPDGIFVANHRI
jgi:FAD/FMN-containing dehydrogenase